MFKTLLPFCIVAVLLGCAESPSGSAGTGGQLDTTTTIIDTTSNASVPGDLMLKLIGEWHDAQGDGRTVFNEQWDRTDDAFYAGLGFVMSGKDTVFIEHLNISERDDGKVFYSARIPSQNAGAPVDFLMTSAVGDSMVFENKEHDFPQRIVYAWQPDGTWKVNVAGPGKEGWRTDRYHFRRRGASPDQDVPPLQE